MKGNDPLTDLLRKEGFTVAEGARDVQHLIHAVSDDGQDKLCSGYRVLPDGTKCSGCLDCRKP